MRRSLAIAALTLVLGGVIATPAGSGGALPPPPDGVLVLGVSHHEGKLGAVNYGWAMTADPITGRTRERRISASTLCHGPVLAIGNRVVLSGHRGRRPMVRSFPLTLSGPPQILGRADVFTPAARRGNVWLGHWTARHTKRARLAMREIDADGRTRAPARDLIVPVWSRLAGALAGGLMVTEEERSLVVRRSARRRALLSIRDGWFAAAQGSRVAWCSGKCSSLRLWTRHGERRYDPPPGMRPLRPAGVFSPDGLRLATGVMVGGRPRVAVIELGTGRWTDVPGGTLDGYQAIAWSPSSRWLYFTAGEHRLLAFRYGARRAVPLPIEPGGTIMSVQTARIPH
jgi:hypothetical protein